MRFNFRPLTEDDARVILAWRYEEPYSLYDLERGSLQGLLDPENGYHAVTGSQGEAVGFCCFGPDARVPGGSYDADHDALDIGLGMRPDLTAKGMGAAFVTAVLEFGQRTFAPSTFRLTVATFNRRAIRVYEKAGFQPGHVFVASTGDGQREFVQMTRRT